MEKIEFVNNQPPYISAENLNQLQDNVENAINEVNTYSTEEVKTGAKWIDGKPIYRKTFSFDNINIDISNYNWARQLNLSDFSYMTVDETHSFFVMSGQRYPLNFAQPQYNSSSSYRLNVTSTNVDFIFYKTNNFSVSDIVVTVEYTKTTD